MNKHINRIVLWFCTGVLSLVLVGVMVSCGLDFGGGGNNGGGKFSDITATYYDVGDDCGAIEEIYQYIPKDPVELKRLIQRDITQQGNTVNLNYIDTSAITDMSNLFKTEEGASFNGSINCWDVSKVENMSNMFLNAEAFNQDINSWKVDNVKKMDGMFAGALAFNKDLSNWKVDKVVDMQAMFSNADSFNKDINSWNVSNVATMRAMFRSTETFNQDISDWDVGKVTDMRDMFLYAAAFDKSLTDWKEHVPSDVNTASMFANAPKVTAIPDWKEAGVCFDPSAHVNVMKDRAELKPKVDAAIASNANVNLNYLEVCNVTDLSGLFNGKTTFNGDVSQWDVSKVTTLQSTFEEAKAFNQDISNWDTSNVTTMMFTFKKAEAFNQNFSKWSVDSLTNVYQMLDLALKICNSYVTGWQTKLDTKGLSNDPANDFDETAHWAGNNGQITLPSC